MRSAVDAILAYNRGLDQPSLQRKLARMSESAFAFFRGAFHLFADDILRGPFHDWALTPLTGAMVGDLHTENFGTFRGVTGDITYDINDFDETATAPYEYDLWRLGCSLALASLDNGHPLGDSVEAVEICARAYLDNLARLGSLKKREEFVN